MGYFKRRMVKKFIENPDDYLVVNPRFCEHKFVDGVCHLCNIKLGDWKKESPYNVEEGR